MNLLAILFLTSTHLFCSVLGGRSVIFPKQNYDSYVELFPLRTMSLKAFTLCMRVGSSLPLKETILFEYRTKERDELTIWRMKDGRYRLYVGGESAPFKLPEMTALLSHLCFTWESNMGVTTAYWNGQRSTVTSLQRGYTLRAGGRVVLGQDADSLLGHFHWHQSFAGEITDVDMWDHVLRPDRIKALQANLNAGRGNVINWATARIKANGKESVVTHDCAY